jgi:hypothetical protein
MKVAARHLPRSGSPWPEADFFRHAGSREGRDKQRTEQGSAAQPGGGDVAGHFHRQTEGRQHLTHGKVSLSLEGPVQPRSAQMGVIGPKTSSLVVEAWMAAMRDVASLGEIVAQHTAGDGHHTAPSAGHTVRLPRRDQAPEKGAEQHGQRLQTAIGVRDRNGHRTGRPGVPLQVRQYILTLLLGQAFQPDLQLRQAGKPDLP